MSDTIDTIVELSVLPLSIIIVGVGKDNFDRMVDLDSDDQLLRGTYGTAKRDIVQFVPYRDFRNDPTRLAQEVLHEVPEQVTSYFRSIKRPPNKAKEVNESMIDNAINERQTIRRTGTIEIQQQSQHNIPVGQPNLNLVQGSNQELPQQYSSYAKPVQIFSTESNLMSRNTSSDQLLLNQMQHGFPKIDQNPHQQIPYQQVLQQQGFIQDGQTAYQPPLHNNIQGVPVNGIENINLNETDSRQKKKKKDRRD